LGAQRRNNTMRITNKIGIMYETRWRRKWIDIKIYTQGEGRWVVEIR
jgi:hypothetical protein